MIRMWNPTSKPKRTKLKAQAWAIQAVAFSADSGTLASADYTTIQLFDVATGRQRLAIPTRHWVFAMALAPDGRTLASGGNRGLGGQEPGVVKLWDAATGKQPGAALDPHMMSVRGVSFSPDGRLLAAWSWGPAEGEPAGAVTLWDAAGRERAAWKGYNSVAFAPDGRTVAVAGQQGLLLWDVATGQQRAALPAPTGRLVSVRFAPDGRTLATGGADGTVRLWDPATGQERASLPGQAAGEVLVDFAPDGNTLAVLCPAEHTVALWDASTWRERAVLRGVSGPLAFTPDGKTLATSGSTLLLWQAATGQQLLTLKAQDFPITCLAFSPDGQVLASGAGWRDENDGVYLWRAAPQEDTPAPGK
jgi:WD40 repeat protein